ncbi:MAG: hypothetical protein J5603_03145 [Bacteroidales bacterium]|nr:hypothetical protein [Bacteroidales bacterium]
MTLPGACLYCLQKRLNAGAACYAEICSGIIIRVHCRAVTWWHIVGLSHGGSHYKVATVVRTMRLPWYDQPYKCRESPICCFQKIDTGR